MGKLKESIRILLGLRDTRGYSFTEEDRIKSTEKKNVLALRKMRVKLLQDEVEQMRHVLQENELRNELKYMKRSMLGDDDDDDTEEDNDDIGGGMEEQAIKIFGQILARNSSNMPIPENRIQNDTLQRQADSMVQAVEKVDLSDEQIMDIASQMPKSLIKKFKKLDENVQSTLIRGHLPGVSDKTTQRILEMVNT